MSDIGDDLGAFVPGPAFPDRRARPAGRFPA